MLIGSSLLDMYEIRQPLVKIFHCIKEARQPDQRCEFLICRDLTE